jgi:hypothetical protein
LGRTHSAGNQANSQREFASVSSEQVGRRFDYAHAADLLLFGNLRAKRPHSGLLNLWMEMRFGVVASKKQIKL